MRSRIGIILMTVVMIVTCLGCSKKSAEETKLTIHAEENLETSDSTNIQKDEGNDVTYTLEGKEKEEMLKSAKDQIEQAIKSIEEDESFSYVKEITHNKNMTKFTVKVDKENYPKENDTVSQILKNVVQTWHQVNGTEDQEIDVIIKKE